MVDLRPDHLAIVQAILRAELPGTEVWAFGSRAKGTARENSDLDLAILGSHPLPLPALLRLRRSFEDSYLPFSVDLVDWHGLDEDFRSVIRSQKQVLQAGDAGVGEGQESPARRAVPLKECAHIVTGTKPPPRDRPDLWGGGIPWVTPGDMKPLRLSDAARYLTEEAVAQGCRVVPAGTVLVLVEGPALQEDVPVCIALRPLSFSSSIRGLVARPGVVPEYLFYMLRGSRPAFRSLVRGSAILRLHRESLANFPISLPPVEEQHATACTLANLEKRFDREPHLFDLLLLKLASGEIRAREAEDESDPAQAAL